MGIPEALRILNDFYARETGQQPSQMLTTTCKCGHGLRFHKHRRGDRRPTEPCTAQGCVCCDFRPLTLQDKVDRESSQ